MMSKSKKWVKPMFEDECVKKQSDSNDENASFNTVDAENDLKNNSKLTTSPNHESPNIPKIHTSSWMKNFDPVSVEDLAVNSKKIQEIEQWLCSMCKGCCSDILLLSGPVGCGKTATVRVLAKKYNVKICEWITPLDIDFPTEYGDYEYREKQSTKFLDFIINAANFTSLLDNNSKKLVLVEDLPNTFIKTPSEFTTVIQEYKNRAKSPLVFICSDSHMDKKNSAYNLFSNTLKEQFNIQHIQLNSVSATSLKHALKRVSDIISKKYSSIYTPPSPEVIQCVVNSSDGDVRSAVLNLHFATLKGSNHNLDTSVIEKEKKTKTTKRTQKSSKFQSIGKDETVSILHGVGRVLIPKRTEDGKLTHDPGVVMDQFVSQAGTFVSFLHENYLTHFGQPDEVAGAADALAQADCLLAEWRERFSQEYGLYVSVAGLMTSNKNPVSAWNPVRGPKYTRVQYPTMSELPLLDQNTLYKGKILVTDFKTYCNIIGREKGNSSF